MRETKATRLIVVALCLLSLGCNEEPVPSESVDREEPSPALTAEMVVQSSEPTLWIDGEETAAIDVLRPMVLGSAATLADGLTVAVYDTHPGEPKLRVVLGRTTDSDPAIDLAAAMDALFAQLSRQFAGVAKQSLIEELTVKQAEIEVAAARVVETQAEIQFQRDALALRPDPATARKLNRFLERALDEQIAAEQRAEAVQKRIERQRFATLLRVR